MEDGSAYEFFETIAAEPPKLGENNFELRFSTSNLMSAGSSLR
jgi:hypothetical protein